MRETGVGGKKIGEYGNVNGVNCKLGWKRDKGKEKSFGEGKRGKVRKEKKEIQERGGAGPKKVKWG